MADHVFETASSDTVYQGRIVALRVDEVTMPGGRTAKREVLEHFGAVAVAAVDDGRIAMVYQYRHPLGRRLWELPAGLLDVADEDPVEAARRELEEETGYTARDWSVLVDAATSPGITDETVRIYLARNVTEVGRPDSEHEEADLTVHWVGLEDAVRMVLNGEIVNAASTAGVLAAHAVINDGFDARAADAAWTDRPTAFARRQTT